MDNWCYQTCLITLVLCIFQKLHGQTDIPTYTSRQLIENRAMYGWVIKVNFSDNIERTTLKDFLLFLDLILDVYYPSWCRSTSKFLQSKMNGVNCWFNWYPSQLPSFNSSKSATLVVPTKNWRHFAITRTPTLVCSIHFRNTHSEWWRIKDQEESICHTSIFLRLF